MPAALTLILICPSPGSRSGIPAHFNTSGGPYPVITTALGIAVPSFLVAASGWPRTATSACSLCAVSAPSIAPCDGAGASRPRSRARSPKPAGRELMAAPARPSRVSAPRAVSLLRPDETLTVECPIGSPKVFASFTVDTLFLSTTSDPWTGPRRSARAARRSPAAPRSAASAGGRRAGRESWVHPRSVAEVEADRLHHLERRALGEDVGGREHARVLLDHGCGCGSDPLFQAALERSSGVVAVLHEVGRQVDGVERLPGALGDVRHVLLVQGNVLAGAEPAEVAGDEVLPRIGQRLRRRREVARDVLGQVREENRRPARVDDVDQHQRVVIGQVDDDVVG